MYLFTYFPVFRIHTELCICHLHSVSTSGFVLLFGCSKSNGRVLRCDSTKFVDLHSSNESEVLIFIAQYWQIVIHCSPFVCRKTYTNEVIFSFFNEATLRIINPRSKL